MRFPARIFILTLCWFLHAHTFAQDPVIDSLLQLLRAENTDTARLARLYEISDEYETLGMYPEGLTFGKRAIALAESILNDVSKNRSQEEIKRVKRLKGKSFSNIGIILLNQGNYPEALQNLFSSLKIMEEIEDLKGKASAFNNIGIIYDEQKNYPQALKYYASSLEIKRATGDKKGISSALNNIGLVHYNKGNYPEALKNYNASLQIKIALGDKKAIAYSYNNLGNTFAAMAERERNPDLRKFNSNLAIKNYLAALELQTEAGNRPAIASCYTNIGSFLTMHEKKYDEALLYLLKAKQMGTEMGLREYLKQTYIALTELDSAKGNFKGAYENHKMFILYRDSLDNEETRKNTIQNQMTYDFEKKEAISSAEHKKELENQQALAEEKSRKQKIILSFVATGLLLILVFAAFIFRSLRTTRKQKNIIEKQKEIVERQKDEVELQKQLVEEHQKEIIDSIMYARRIQQALLPTEKYIAKTLARLNK